MAFPGSVCSKININQVLALCMQYPPNQVITVNFQNKDKEKKSFIYNFLLPTFSGWSLVSFGIASITHKSQWKSRMCVPRNVSFSLGHQSVSTSYYLSLHTWPLIKRVNAKCSMRQENHHRTLLQADIFYSNSLTLYIGREKIYLAVMLQANYMEKSNNISNYYHLETIKIVTNRHKQTYTSCCFLEV